MATYGQGDSSSQAAGREAGIRKLVDDFYNIMSNDVRYQTIYAWHPENTEQSRDKLARFLCGWMGGPRLYQERYGPISIPGVHAHLRVTEVERDLWLQCMNDALSKQQYSDEFKDYLITQLAIPAERIRQTCKGVKPTA
ncbi:MAG: group II truncated hemoglobin [Pseudomonadales bacterium]